MDGIGVISQMPPGYSALWIAVQYRIRDSLPLISPLDKNMDALLHSYMSSRIDSTLNMSQAKASGQETS